jgi:L-iditol 2-dehydrogenase
MVKAAALEAVGKLAIHDYPVPKVAEDGILLKMEMCGVCGTDVHIYDGKMKVPYPVILGHEFVGRIEEIGSKARGMEVKKQPLKEGDLVSVVPGTNRFCGTCYYCRFVPQKVSLCENRRALGVNQCSANPPHLLGGWAEKIYVDAAHYWVYKVPEEVPAEVAVLAEPMAVSSRALERAYEPGTPTFGDGFGVGKSVVVQGAGPIGLLAMATAKIAGAGKIIAVDMIDEKLKMAEKIGADHVIDMRVYKTRQERVEAVKKLTNGMGGDVVIEAAGVPSAFAEGIDLTRRGGKFVEVGHYTDPGNVEVNPHTICNKDIDILGSWAYPPSQFETALQLFRLSMDRIPLHEMVTHRFHIAEAQKAIDTAKARQGLKLAVVP